jgi:GDP-L-fucose synthase
MSAKRVFIAGHRGMVGAALVRALALDPDTELITANRDELDLLDPEAVSAFIHRQRPDMIYMAAARVGGIYANNTYPAEFIHQNLVMEANLIHAAHTSDVQQLLFLGSSCIYPKHAPQPLREDALLTGPLEPTNRAYAVAKIAAIELCDAYRAQYGADFVSAMPTNLYGPGDDFDLRTSHVLPALLRKTHEAKLRGADAVEVWGSGTPRREFLYVDDLADAALFLLEHVSEPGPINVGTGVDLTIRELAETIMDVVGFEGDLTFDRSKPDGTPRKQLDVSKLRDLGWTASTGLREGLERTYAAYLAQAT